MALDLQIGGINEKTRLILTDETGDYNAVTNPTGWGAPNPTRANATAATLSVTQPDGTVVAVGSILATDFFTQGTEAYELPNTVGLMDGVYTFDVSATISASPYTATIKVLRDTEVKQAVLDLATGDLDIVDWENYWLKYERAVLAFENGEYVLAEELIEDLTAELTDCGYQFSNCGC